MPKKEINVELEQLPTSVSKEFIQSLESKLGFSKTQTYFPVMNKYTEFDNNEKEKKEFILSSKYQCTKINDLVFDDSDDEEEAKINQFTDLNDNITDNNTTNNNSDQDNNNSKNNSDNSSEKSIHLDDESLDIENQMSNNIVITGNIYKKGKEGKNHTYQQKAFIKLSPLIEPIKFVMDKYYIQKKEKKKEKKRRSYKQ